MGMIRDLRASRGLTAFGTLLVTTTFVACEVNPTAVDLPGQLIDGITYRVTSFVIAESFPVQLGITVELENESTTPQSVTFPDGCVVLMRAYDSGTEPVWDMGQTVACTLALVEVDLVPGESVEFKTGLVSAATILEGGLAAGEYLITAYLRPGDTVEIEAGSVDLAIS